MPAGTSAATPVNIQSGLVGNIPVNNFDNGQKAGPGTFWRGDGHWGGPGYGTGSGGSVNQTTNVSTTVTLNKPTGQINCVSATFTAGTPVAFLVNNSTIGATDTVIAISNVQAVIVYASNISAGNSFIMNIYPVSNNTNALVINFCIIKGASS